ncbi:MAG TPA: DUF4870 domain-containing protein [Actinomycetes bacterium]|nr:DUF4870 domain-containing protein [Actinomycetes bacterium]
MTQPPEPPPESTPRPPEPTPPPPGPPPGEAPYGQPSAGQPPAGQPGWQGQGAGFPEHQAAGQGQLSPADERTWGMLAHLSALLAAFVALAFLGPLLVMLIQGPKSEFVRRQSVEALNFQITTYIAAIISAILIVLLIGLILLPIVGIAWLVLTIMAGLAANRGEDYRYPFNIRLVK